MSDVKRYEIGGPDWELDVSPIGEWVSWDDYAALEAELVMRTNERNGLRVSLDTTVLQVEALQAELARLRAGQEPVAFYWQDVGYKNPNRHGPYFGWPTEAALRNVDGGAIPVPLYTTPQPSAVPAGWKLVPVEPTEEMLESDFISCHCGHDFSPALFDHVWHKMLAAAPSAPATVSGVNQQLLEALEELMYARTDKAEALATAAIAAARQEDGKV